MIVTVDPMGSHVGIWAQDMEKKPYCVSQIRESDWSDIVFLKAHARVFYDRIQELQKEKEPEGVAGTA